MPMTVILELRMKPESVAATRELMSRTLQDTRAFDGQPAASTCSSMQDDEAHWIIYEVWESVEHDEAYRAFRAGEGQDGRASLHYWPYLRSRRGMSPATSSSARE